MSDERTPLLLPPAQQPSSAPSTASTAGSPTGVAAVREPPSPAESDAAAAADTISKADFRWLMVGLWMMTFIASLDGTIVATLISTIGSAFQEMRLSGWIGTSYLLSVCCFTPLYGRLSDILGRRWSCMLAAGLFGGGTILCGCASSMRQLLLFRLIAGMGGGGIAVTNSIVVSDHVSLKDRGVYQGFTNLLFGLGAACGAPLGGYISDNFGWRIAFLCQSPLLLGGMLLIFLKCKEPKSFLASSTSGWDKVKRIDYLGSLTLVGGIGTLLLAMSLKTTSRLPFSDPTIYGLLIASGLSLGAFVAVESWVVQPVMPLSLLAHRTSGFVALNNLIIAIVSFAVLYNVPLFFVTVLLRTSANAGSHLIPNSCMIMIGSLGAGAIMRKTGKYYYLELAGACGIITSSVIFIFWDYDTPEWVLYLTMIPSGLGFSCVLTTTLVALLSSVPREQISVATGVSYLFRTTGQVLGVSLSATLLQALLERNLRARIDDEQVILRILDSTKYILTLPADVQRQATDSWLASLRVIFILILVLAVLLLGSLLPIEENPLPGSIEQEEADRKAAVARGEGEV